MERAARGLLPFAVILLAFLVSVCYNYDIKYIKGWICNENGKSSKA